VQKAGIPCKQLHSYDYGRPVRRIPWRDQLLQRIDRMVNTKIWQYVQAPWEAEEELQEAIAS